MTDTTNRITLCCVSTFAALAFWALTDNLDDPIGGTLFYLALIVLVLVGAGMFLALKGPLDGTKAVIGSAWMAIFTAFLTLLAMLRFEDARAFWDTPLPFFALFGLSLIAAPFLIAALRMDSTIRDYPALFTHAWQIAVRAIAAWAFTGAVWLLLLLSDGVLDIVNIDFIGRLIRVDAVAFAITGAALGFGAAIVYELRNYIQPALVLRLLRVLLPPMLAVAVLFVIGFVVQSGSGAARLFGGLSPAALLMSLAFIAAALVTTALDIDDTAAVQGRGMRWMTAAMAMVLPVLGAIAVYGVVVRVMAYGWTPNRVVAICVAGVLLAYGLIYAGAVVRRKDWRGTIRRGNITLAALVFGVVAAMFTPLINAHKISTTSQLARFEAGQTEVGDLPLFEMAREWGTAGKAGIARLEAVEGNTLLAERIVLAKTMLSARMTQVNTPEQVTQTDIDQLLAQMIIQPATSPAAREVLSTLDSRRFAGIRNRCDRASRDTPKGCMALVIETHQLGDVTLFLAKNLSTVRFINAFSRDAGGAWTNVRIQNLGDNSWTQTSWQDLIEGTYSVGPVQGTSLQLGPVQIFPYN